MPMLHKYRIFGVPTVLLQIGRKPHPNKTLTLIEVQMFSETDCAGFHNGNAIPEYHFCASNPKEKVGVCWVRSEIIF